MFSCIASWCLPLFYSLHAYRVTSSREEFVVLIHIFNHHNQTCTPDGITKPQCPFVSSHISNPPKPTIAYSALQCHSPATHSGEWSCCRCPQASMVRPFESGICTELTKLGSSKLVCILAITSNYHYKKRYPPFTSRTRSANLISEVAHSLCLSCSEARRAKTSPPPSMVNSASAAVSLKLTLSHSNWPI